MKQEFSDYLNDILLAVNAIEMFNRGMTQDEFTSDLKTIHATRKAIEIK